MAVPSPKIDQWVSVEFICRLLTGSIVETVFQYKSSTSAISEGDLIAFATLWRDTMTPLLRAALSSNVTLQSVKATTHFATFPNVQAEVFFPAGTVGSVASPESPGNVTLATKLLTGIIGRRNRGRQFWPSLALNAYISDTATSTTLNLLSQIFVRHLLGWTTVGVNYIPAVVSRKNLLLRVVVEFAIEAILDSMRRRLSGRGT